MNKKILALILALVLVVGAVIGGTLAYFTDKTAVKENTFTVGKVDIDLEEPLWDEAGYDEEGPVLMPGVYVDKDPTVTVAEDSEDCYLFVNIEMRRYAGILKLIAEHNEVTLNQLTPQILRNGFDEFIQGINHTEWKMMNAADILAALAGNTIPKRVNLVLGYQGAPDESGAVLAAGAKVKVFKKLGLPTWVTQDMEGYTQLADPKANDITMWITAYAIQAAGINTLDAAYAALPPTLITSAP